MGSNHRASSAEGSSAACVAGAAHRGKHRALTSIFFSEKIFPFRFSSRSRRARARPRRRGAARGRQRLPRAACISRESPATEIEPAPCVSADATPSTETQYARLSVAIRCGSRASARAAAKTPKPLSDKASFLVARPARCARRGDSPRLVPSSAEPRPRPRLRPAGPGTARRLGRRRPARTAGRGAAASPASLRRKPREACAGTNTGSHPGLFAQNVARAHPVPLERPARRAQRRGSCAYAQSALHAFPRMNSLHAGVPSAAAGEQCSPSAPAARGRGTRARGRRDTRGHRPRRRRRAREPSSWRGPRRRPPTHLGSDDGAAAHSVRDGNSAERRMRRSIDASRRSLSARESIRTGHSVRGVSLFPRRTEAVKCNQRCVVARARHS